MKTLKKILSIFVILSMLASLLIITSYASSEVTYILDTINYTDANGDALLTLDGAAAIKVNSAVTASASSDVMFVAALYNGDTLVKTSGKATVTAAAGVKAELSATITLDAALPTPATGYEVKTFVWEDDGKTPIIKANVFPNNDTALASVTVDGTEIEVADTMTYEVAIDRMVAPEVAAKAANASTKVSVTKPTTFPGSATITLTANDGTEKDYTIKYKAASALLNASTSNYGTDFHAADDPNANETSDKATPVTTFKRGSQLYADRADSGLLNQGYYQYFNDIRTISDEWDYLNGTDFFKSAINDRATTFTLNRDAVVRVFSKYTDYALTVENGWTSETNTNGYMTASTTSGQGLPEGYNPNQTATSNDGFNYMSFKSFDAGETVNITPTYKESITVIDYVGYLAEPETALASLSIGGEAVKSADIYHNTIFTYAVAGDEDTVPSVEAEAFDGNAEVEIVYPGMENNGNIFPGKTIVRVTSGSKSKEYIVKYTTTDALLSTTDGKYGNDFYAADDYNATVSSGYTVGSKLYSDRDCPVTNAAGLAYFNDIRAIDEDWDYLNGTDYFMNAVTASSRTVTFTLNRDAVVRVFSDTNAVPDWTKESKTSGYVIASSTSGHLTAENSNKFTNMFYKSFVKGETVSFTPAAMTAITVIDYAGYTKTPVSLETLEVGGEAKTIGAESTFTHPVAPGAEICPAVVATAADSSATVEVIYPGQQNNPNVFPGKTVIRVTKGDMTKDYEVQYTVSGAMLTTSDAKYGTNFHAADDENASIVSGYLVGSQLYSDRSTPTTNSAGLAYYNDIRTISDEWDYLNGTDFFMSKTSGNATATFTLNRAAVVRVFSQGSAAVTDDGWTKEYKVDGYVRASTTSGEGITAAAATFNYMYYKSFNAGDTVSVTPGPKESITVVDYASYLETYVALATLEVGGEAKEVGLDKSWSHPVAADATVCPAVVATAVDPAANVEVIYPFEEGNVNIFPGKTIIRVTNGSDMAEYTVQYTCDNFVGLSAASSSNGGSFFGTNFHEASDTGLAGSKLYYDRVSPYYESGVLLYYNDIHEICDELEYLKGTDYIMANRNQGANITHTFTLVRPATIRTFHLKDYNAGNATLTDWTTETKADGYLKLSHTTGAGVEGSGSELMVLDSTTYKKFDAGEAVSVASPGAHAIVVIDYAGYTEAE